VTFSFPVRIDRRAEWTQLFEEAWRVMKYRFYDEKMHGRDWAAIKARYKPLLRYVGTNEDVYDLANEMIGELNASHTGVSGPPTRPMPRAYQTRFLGFEMEPADGRYRVSHVYRNGPADREWLDLKVGDYVLAIDGQELKAGDNYWKALSQTLNEYVPVRIARSASGEAARTVRIASVTSLTDIKYEEWVAERRAIVEQESNGELAYVHIRSMDQPSLARFRNEIDQFANRKGIVVDIRFNGGGNIDQELIDILERRPYQYWNQRTGSRVWGRRPRQAIAGTEGHAHQPPLRLRQRGDADGLPSAGARAHRRQPDGRGGDRDGELRADQRGRGPDARLAGRDLRPDEAQQLRHQPRELRGRAGRVGGEHAGGRHPEVRPGAEGGDRRGAAHAARVAAARDERGALSARASHRGRSVRAHGSAPGPCSMRPARQRPAARSSQ
jgi:hypothetical protein